MFDTIFGLPMHPLVVHATVVVVPTAALSIALAACWPRFRRWAGFLPLLLSVVALLLVPLSTSSGESLERHVPETELLRQHTEMADGLLVWVIILTVAAAGLYWQDRTSKLPRRALVTVAISVLAAVGVVGTVVQVVRIGHSGAKAAWSETSASTAQSLEPPGAGH
ncbi:DUF2231 domain-containing protein [Angustibacter sp. McL0619]|uniref:DUF2231 domain-containing protein n=1 Tax=Angustibacter sp. McL0619 TaxID=3415676 RepID=UPI003CFA67C6